MERKAYDGEVELTETIFNLIGQDLRFELDFADNGREIFLTNKETNECFTITITQDE